MIDTRSFTVLTVCTGNICRSPAAERLLSAGLGPSVTVLSAGTHAMRGMPISPPMDSLIERADASAGGFSARQLTEAVVRPVDLLLALTRAHRSATVEVWPASVRKAFTLRQFARLMSVIDPTDLPTGTAADRLAVAVPLAAAARGRVAADPEADDVADPYRRGDEAYAHAFTEIRAAVDAIVAVIVPRSV